MRCKSCDYRLWNLRSRVCPECGTPFKPSEFEFAQNSVQFCCPHCGQDYYGTGEKGHLRPFEFNCVRCKNRVNMDDMVVLPTSGVEEEQTQVGRMPWLDERRSGFRRWTGTLRMALVQPGEMMHFTPPTGPASREWNFFLITNLIVMVLASGVICLFPLIGVWATPGAAGARGAGAGIVTGMGIGLLVAAVCVALGVVLWALVAHGLLRLTGQTAFGLRRTQQALLYSSGANIVSAIPCLGSYFGWIWWVISAIVALRSAQRISGPRAALAVLVLPLAAIVAVIAFYVWLLFFVIGVATAAGGGYSTNAGVTLTMNIAVRAYADLHNGAGPTHPAEFLLQDVSLSPLDFVVQTETPPNQVQVGGAPLGTFESLDERAQKKAIADAVAEVGTGRTPIKFGDFVFVYQGLNLTTCPRDAWIVIHEPSAVYRSTPNGGFYEVALANGQASQIPAAAFLPMLAHENTRRATLGAAPIPEALVVTTMAQPASAPAGKEP